MGGGNWIRQKMLDPQKHINSISSVSRVKSSSQTVFRSGAPGTVAINEGDTNTDTVSYGRNRNLLNPTHFMADLFVFKLVDNGPTPEVFQIGTCGTSYDCPRNHKTYILLQNKILFFGCELDH